VYLQNSVEESDWDILTEIALSQAESIMEFEKTVREYEEKDEKVLYIDDHCLFPNAMFVKNSNSKYNHFQSEEYIESISRCMIDGLIPFLERFVEMMPNTGTRQEREILSRIQKQLRSSKSKDKLNAFDIFKRDYMQHVKANGVDFVENAFENDKAITKSKIERNNILKKEI
jgi:hypothetical protein